MAAIQGKWYAEADLSIGREALDGKGERRLVFSTMPDGKKYIVAKTFAGDDGDFAATAHLVAAAPQLLAACKRMMAMIQEIDRTLGRNPGVIFDALGAIHQAEGKGK